jgi:hypothetical protein
MWYYIGAAAMRVGKPAFLGPGGSILSWINTKVRISASEPSHN